MSKKQTIILTFIAVFIIGIYGIYVFEAGRKAGRKLETEIETEPEPEIEPEPESEPEPEPEPESTWHTYGRYSVNPEVMTHGSFSIPEYAEKIRLTFKVTYTAGVPKYVLQAKILQDGEILWEIFSEYKKQTKTWEIEGISGDFTINVLIVLGKTELTVEWYG